MSLDIDHLFRRGMRVVPTALSGSAPREAPQMPSENAAGECSRQNAETCLFCLRRGDLVPTDGRHRFATSAAPRQFIGQSPDTQDRIGPQRLRDQQTQCTGKPTSKHGSAWRTIMHSVETPMCLPLQRMPRRPICATSFPATRPSGTHTCRTRCVAASACPVADGSSAQRARFLWDRTHRPLPTSWHSAPSQPPRRDRHHTSGRDAMNSSAKLQRQMRHAAQMVGLRTTLQQRSWPGLPPGGMSLIPPEAGNANSSETPRPRSPCAADAHQRMSANSGRSSTTVRRRRVGDRALLLQIMQAHAFSLLFDAHVSDTGKKLSASCARSTLSFAAQMMTCWVQRDHRQLLLQQLGRPD